MKTILMTGAYGSVATFLRRELAGRYALRLSDRLEISDLGGNETFVAADITDMAVVEAAVEGVNGIIHLGGYSVEGPWDAILQANIIGAYNVFETARRRGVKRLVFPSSNHAVGFHRRDHVIDHTCLPRPDSRYGVSKAFGEALGSLYADKYGAEVLCIRIGNVNPEPIDVRRLSIWISPRDLAQLVTIGLEHPDIRFEVVYGMSDNARGFWDNSNALRLGYAPEDASEHYAEAVIAAEAESPEDPQAALYQGGIFALVEEVDLPGKPDAD